MINLTRNTQLMAVLLFNSIIMYFCSILLNKANGFLVRFPLFVFILVSDLTFLWAITHLITSAKKEPRDLTGGFGMLGTVSATGVIVYLLRALETVDFSTVSTKGLLIGSGLVLIVAVLSWAYSSELNYRIFTWGAALAKRYYQ